MQKLSVLIFSKDDLEQALDLIRDSYEVADEIVLMDASGAKRHAWIEKQKAAIGLEKLKVYRVVALGYREPLMMYALKKCRNRWVMALNTDERMSGPLKSKIPALLNSSGYDAYSIPLYSVWSAKSRTFVSNQVRLFKKDRIEFRGLLHEKPIVHGTFRTLQSDECIEHITTGMLHTTKGEYAELERFERYTYAQHNLRLIDQLDRVRGKDTYGKAGLTAGKRAVLGLLRLYEALGLKSPDQEVSNFDYFMFSWLRNAAHQARRRSMRGIVSSFGWSLDYIRKMRRWRTGPYGDIDFEIAKIINKIGVTRFLELDREKVVESLNKKYAHRAQGVGLLIKLLREKYMNNSRRNNR
jgi:hypothetical protein